MKNTKSEHCTSVLLSHPVFILPGKYVLDHLVQPVKSLYLLKYLFYINKVENFKDLCYLHCLSFNVRALPVPSFGPVGLQNAGVGG